MSDFNERDRQLMALVGLTEEQVLADERMADSETVPDDLTGRVHYGLHLTEPTRLRRISYAVFCLKKKKTDEITRAYMNFN
ncbi:hypothetical protein MCC02034_18430 [Bifidobacteriaceae bacterium MCC02034]|nr:hypothetical protein MCC02034_18430 [Bifidobacteriaceae bacterium MCC02034]